MLPTNFLMQYSVQISITTYHKSNRTILQYLIIFEGMNVFSPKHSDQTHGRRRRRKIIG